MTSSLPGAPVNNLHAYQVLGYDLTAAVDDNRLEMTAEYS